MLGQRLRRWPSINPTLVQGRVFYVKGVSAHKGGRCIAWKTSCRIGQPDEVTLARGRFYLSHVLRIGRQINAAAARRPQTQNKWSYWRAAGRQTES